MTLDPRLHDYQRVAAEYLRGHEAGAGLFLDMGLGKTFSVLAALEPRHLPVLVCAPKRVAEETWPEQLGQWRPDLRYAIAAGTPAARRKALEAPDTDVVIIGRDNLADATSYAGRFRTFVIDELSGFKAFGAARSKAARQIKAALGGPHVWGLTGTPAPNGLFDLWSQVGLLDGGARLGSTKSGFLREWFTLHASGRPDRLRRNDFDPYPPGHHKEWISSTHVEVWVPKDGARERMFAALEDLCLSMETDGRIELPPVTRNVIPVTLPRRAQQAYRDLSKNMLAAVELLGVPPETHTATTAASLVNRLSQVTAGGLYVDDADLRGGAWSPLHEAKAALVEEIADGASGGVLVFYGYRFEVDLLRARLGDRMHTMDEPDVVRRWNAGAVPVLVAHPASAGHGLNLQHGGHTIVWTTVPWSLEEWQQANKRLARQGQKHPVVVHVLQVPDTVDGLRLTRVDGKAEVQGALLAHLDSLLA